LNGKKKMSRFDGTVFADMTLSRGTDEEMILKDITVGNSNGNDYIELNFEGAYSSAFQYNPRFWAATKAESKIGYLVQSLADNLDKAADVESLESLIGHRLVVRRWKEKITLNTGVREVEYVNIMEDLGSEGAPSAVDFSFVADLVHGMDEEDALDALSSDETVQSNRSVYSQVLSGTIIDTLIDEGLVVREGDLLRKA
jgi:hypothetical protein